MSKAHVWRLRSVVILNHICKKHTYINSKTLTLIVGICLCCLNTCWSRSFCRVSNTCVCWRENCRLLASFSAVIRWWRSRERSTHMLYLFFSLAREEGLRTVVYFSITIRKRARTKERSSVMDHEDHEGKIRGGQWTFVCIDEAMTVVHNDACHG